MADVIVPGATTVSSISIGASDTATGPANPSVGSFYATVPAEVDPSATARTAVRIVGGRRQDVHEDLRRRGYRRLVNVLDGHV